MSATFKKEVRRTMAIAIVLSKKTMMQAHVRVLFDPSSTTLRRCSLLKLSCDLPNEISLPLVDLPAMTLWPPEACPPESTTPTRNGWPPSTVPLSQARKEAAEPGGMSNRGKRNDGTHRRILDRILSESYRHHLVLFSLLLTPHTCPRSPLLSWLAPRAAFHTCEERALRFVHDPPPRPRPLWEPPDKGEGGGSITQTGRTSNVVAEQQCM